MAGKPASKSAASRSAVQPTSQETCQTGARQPGSSQPALQQPAGIQTPKIRLRNAGPRSRICCKVLDFPRKTAKIALYNISLILVGAPGAESRSTSCRSRDRRRVGLPREVGRGAEIAGGRDRDPLGARCHFGRGPSGPRAYLGPCPTSIDTLPWPILD